MPSLPSGSLCDLCAGQAFVAGTTRIAAGFDAPLQVAIASPTQAANFPQRSSFSGTLSEADLPSRREENNRLPLPSAKHAWIASATLALLAAAGIGAYLHVTHRNAPRVADEGGLPIYSATPEQTKRTLEALDELPGDAPSVAYIDVEALRKLHDSPLAALLGLTGGNAAEDREYEQFVQETGFDYTRDLDRVAIAFWFDGLGGRSRAASADNRAFVVADGRFDAEKIRRYALQSGRTRVAGTQTVYDIPGKPPVSFTFLSPTRIAITSGDRSAEFLLASHPRKRDRAFQTHIDRLAGAPLFAVVRTDQLPGRFYASFDNSPQIESLLRSVRSLTLAAKPQGEVLKVALDGESTSANNALTITTLLEISRMGASMAFSDSKPPAQLTHEQTTFLDALIQKSTISHQDQWVRIAFDVTPRMLGSGDLPSPAVQTRRGDAAK